MRVKRQRSFIIVLSDKGEELRTSGASAFEVVFRFINGSYLGGFHKPLIPITVMDDRRHTINKNSWHPSFSKKWKGNALRKYAMRGVKYEL